ncbi:MAG: hypothetical protein GDA52_06990 [Rhodobacteraceae bacterium]|nr:hypothetical protein [Paracoccaceae bacterium]
MLIEYLFDKHFILVLFGLCALELMYLACVWNNYALPRHKNELRCRMEAYAELNGCSEKENSCQCGKEPPCQCGKEPSCPGVLKPKTHEVLLGTLKKIEAKGAVNTTILVFALTISVAILLTPSVHSLETEVQNLVLTFISLLILPTWMAFRGTYQIDQLNFPGCSGSGFCLKKRMQDDLIDDLLAKERAFRFTRNSTQVTIIGFLLIVVLDGILPALFCTDSTSSTLHLKNQLFLADHFNRLVPE